MVRNGIAARRTASLIALLTMNLLTTSGAIAQTRDGGTVQGTWPGLSSKQVAEKLALYRVRALEEQRRSKGFEVRNDPKATGEALAVQKRMAGLLAADDFVPEPRRERFRWMYESKQTPVTGWFGTILCVTSDRGEMVVTVRVWARSVGGFSNLASTVERYRFVDGRLRFLDLVYKPGVSTWN
jgi:hypothetical protein